MRDDDGQALDCDVVLQSVEELRERDRETCAPSKKTPLNPTELRHLDLIESIFSVDNPDVLHVSIIKCQMYRKLERG